MGLKLTDQPINVLLGNRVKECFGNLRLCKHGLTISMWTQQRQQTERLTYGQIFHSHDVSIYLVRGQLFAVFQMPKRMWSIAAPMQDKNRRYRHYGSSSWRHVAISWHPERGLKLYIDGKLVKEAEGGFWEQGAAGFAGNDSSIGATTPHKNGSVVVDEVRFWNMSLDMVTVESIFEWESNPRKPYHVIKKAEVKAKSEFPVAPGMKYYITMDQVVNGKLIGDGIDGHCGKYCRSHSISGHRALRLNRYVVDFGRKLDECFGNIDLCFNGFSLSMWILTKRSHGQFFFFTSGGKQPGFFISTTKDRLYITVQSIRRRRKWDLGQKIKKGTWLHIVMTWSMKSGLLVFLDGKEHRAGSGYLHRPIEVRHAEEGVQIGYRVVKSRTRKRVNGDEWIDQVRFWERHLSKREASGIFKAEEANIRLAHKRYRSRRRNRKSRLVGSKKESKAKRSKRLRARQRLAKKLAAQLEGKRRKRDGKKRTRITKQRKLTRTRIDKESPKRTKTKHGNLKTRAMRKSKTPAIKKHVTVVSKKS